MDETAAFSIFAGKKQVKNSGIGKLIHIDLLMGVQAEDATTYNLRVTTRREQQSHVTKGKMLTDPVLQVSL